MINSRKSSQLFLLALIIQFLLVACGDTNQGGDSSQPSEPQGNVPFYAINAGCPQYFSSSNSPSWFSSYGNQTVPRLFLAERTGVAIQEIDVSSYGLDYAQFREEDLSKVLRGNEGKYLIFECTYQQGNKSQTFRYMHPVKDPKAWVRASSRSESTTAFFYVNMLSDLQFRIFNELVASGATEDSAWKESIEVVNQEFPGAKFGLVFDERLVGCCFISPYFYELAEETDPSGRAFRKLKLLAEIKTSEPTGDVEAILELAAGEWGKWRTKGAPPVTPSVTRAVFSQMNRWLSSSPDNFSRSQWILRQGSDPAFLSSQSVSIDGSWTAKITATGDTATSDYSVQKYQDVKLPPGVDYSEVLLDFSLINARGGCSSGIFSCVFSSGISGVFLCYLSAADDTLGCTLFTAVSDAITIPVAVGNAFDANKPMPGRLYETVLLSPGSPLSPAFGLDRTVAISDLLFGSTIPELRGAASRKEIASVSIGAVVFASHDNCYRCEAEIAIKRLGILAP